MDTRVTCYDMQERGGLKSMSWWTVVKDSRALCVDLALTEKYYPLFQRRMKGCDGSSFDHVALFYLLGLYSSTLSVS